MASELDLDVSISFADLNEDLLVLILLSLPPKSIFRFRSVSKTWNNIISTPFFLQSYQRRGRAKDSQYLLVSTTITKRNQNIEPPRTKKILPLARINDHDFKIDILLSNEISRFINSSNGLTLFYMPGGYSSRFKILNPLTGKTVSLPDLSRGQYHTHCTALICEKSSEELVPSYKVVVVDDHTENKTLTMNTYSSKTSKWTSSALMVKEDVILSYLQPPLVVNGIVHWLSFNIRHLIVYDSNRGHVQLIKLPVVDGGHYKFKVVMSGGDDDLWLAVQEYNTRILELWMLPKGGSESSLITEWISKYRCSLDHLVKENSDSYIYIEALIPGKPHTVVLRTELRFLVYNNKSKSVKEIMKHNGISNVISPYMEPVCLSSYAL